MILNLTQHPATPEQIAAGAVDIQGASLEAMKAALTFEAIPTREEISARAADLAWLADSALAAARRAARAAGKPIPESRAMIGGAPYLMAALEGKLRMRGIEPLYAFSVRESVEAVQPDGSVRKVAIFKHAGFVSAGGAL